MGEGGGGGEERAGRAYCFTFYMYDLLSSDYPLPVRFSSVPGNAGKAW